MADYALIVHVTKCLAIKMRLPKTREGDMRALLIAGLVSVNFMISHEIRAELPDLTGGYQCNGHCESGNACATIGQNGIELTIVDPQGRKASGRFLSNSAIEYGNHVGVIDDDAARIVWNNDTIWVKTTLCPNP